MIKKILSGYSNILKRIAKILLLVLVCVLFSLIVVFPLWKFATVSPSIYTAVVSAFFIIVLLFFLSKKCLKYCCEKNLTAEEKSNRKKSLLLTIVKTLIILIGIAFACFLVLKNKRLLALIALLITVVLYGILAFGVKKQTVQSNNNE